MKRVWLQAADFAGIVPDVDQIALMDRYQTWLSTEAVTSGAIGPAETDRIDRRHLGDSLLFASLLPETVATVWDLGTGVGLPGIPLAICLPGVEFRLVDRSGRRVDLLRRVVRILGLENSEVVRADIANLEGNPDAIVSRASLPPDLLRGHAERYLHPGGVAVVAGSWQERPVYDGWDTVEIPRDALDHTVWLLIMRRE